MNKQTALDSMKTRYTKLHKKRMCQICQKTHKPTMLTNVIYANIDICWICAENLKEKYMRVKRISSFRGSTDIYNDFLYWKAETVRKIIDRRNKGLI